MKSVKTYSSEAKNSFRSDSAYMNEEPSLKKKESEKMISHEEMMRCLGLTQSTKPSSIDENLNTLNINLANP